MPRNPGSSNVPRCVIGPHAVSLALGLLVTPMGQAQDPVIGPRVRIDVNGGTRAANETTAAASEADPYVIVAAWNDSRDGPPEDVDVRLGVSLSFDGGGTWEDFFIRPPKQFQAHLEGDPMTAYDDRTGTLWVGAIAFGEAMFVARLNPGETEFEAPVIVVTSPPWGLDKGWMAAGPRMGDPDSTRVYVVYQSGIQWSDDMGDTWTLPPRSLGGGLGFLPRIGPNGELYVAVGTKLLRSLDNGSSFTTHTITTRMDNWSSSNGTRFPGRFRVPTLMYLDVSRNTGKLYACYFDTTNIVNNQRNVDLYFTTSSDLGETWTTPVVINGDNDPPGDQFWPWIELDERDRIHIVFLDSRHTDQRDDVINGMFDAYYTYSGDDGATWNEFRLTPNSWNSADDGLDLSFGRQFLGDYLGMAVAGNRVYPIYIDTSNGDPDIYTNVIEFPPACVADVNDDGFVDLQDLLRILTNWGPCPGCPEDLDGDGSVGFAEILIVLGAWGPCP